MCSTTWLRLPLVLVMTGASFIGHAQVGIPAADGGFESGTSTFASNGWQTALPAANREWRVGTPPGSVAPGTKAAYVGAAANFNGANTAQVGHFYRDVVIPAGATNVSLSFSLRMPVIDNTFDFIRVYTTTTANTPVSGTSPGAGYVLRFENTATAYAAFTAITPIDLSALAGTTVRLVFTNVSDGVTPVATIAVDNVQLNYTPNTPCAGLPNGGTTPANLTTCPGGTATISATGATAGSGISYAWEEFTAGNWVPVVGGSGANTLSYTTSALSAPKQYRMVVTCANGGQSAPSTTSTVTPTLTTNCYCGGVAPSAGTDDGTGVRNVTFGTINNTSPGGPAYTNFTAQQTTVDAGGSYPLSVQVNTAGDFTVFTKAWFDWDRSGSFEPSEEYDLGNATNGNPLLTSLSPRTINVPANASSGLTLMRVRATYDEAPLACGAQDFTEAEDYVVNIIGCTAPTASLTVSDDCANGQFSIDVNVAALGSGAVANIRYSVNGGAPIQVNNVGTGSTVIGPFATTDEVEASVNNGPPGCATPAVLLYSGCPIELVCGTTLEQNYCYQNNDTRSWTFTSSNPNETLTLTFISGTIDAAGDDVLRIYSGTDDSGPLLASSSVSNLAGLTATSEIGTSSIYMEVVSDGSNSCQDAAQTAWLFEVECTAGCADPDGTVLATTDCANYVFNLDVEVLFVGDAASGTTSIEYTVNGGAPVVIPGLVEFDIENLGPFAIDDVVNVRLLHGDDNACDRNLGTFTDDGTCPPAGTDCASARPVSSYPYTHSATTCGAGNELGIQCSGLYGGGEDYVYRLTIANPGLYAINLLATNGGSYIGWFLKADGNCTTGGACLASATSGSGTAANGTYTFATAGTYYLIIDTWPAPDCSAYDLTITYELCPTPVATGATAIGFTQASANWTGAAGNYIVEWGPAATFTTPGSGAAPGVNGTVILNATSPQVITGLTAGTQYRYFVRRDCGVDGYSANSQATTFTTSTITAILPNTCAQNLAIVDDGCITDDVLYAGFTISGQPNSLGTNVGLESVDIILTHTWRADLLISLISPSGQEVQLVNGRGGENNNFGNNANCPTAVFKLKDGGNALSTIPLTNNVTGTYAPEQALALFTGDPNGAWALRICDDAGGDSGALRFLRLNFQPYDCNGVLGGPAMPGTACNDNDVCTTNDVWTVACACAGTYQDTDGDLICDAQDDCPLLPGMIGDACDAGPSFVLGTIDAGCTCVGQQCSTDLTLEFQTDGAPEQITWEIREEVTNIQVQSGGPLNAPNGVQTNFTCLPDGCFILRVFDAAGDGMTTGGYILRTLATGERIIDNRNNFSTGTISAISGGQGFCLPMSSDKVIFTSCDKLDWINGQYVVAAPNPAVSGQWLTGDQTDDGYEFWIFDPNGSYSFRRFRNHATSDGFGPASATRACHMKLNNWAVANQVPANRLMNVRVRTRVNGVSGAFGPACRLAINPTLAACPQTQLMNIPGDPDFSCGATRMWGTGNLVHARPVSGANRYQFRFRIPAEGFSVTRTVTTYFTQLNWSVLPLQDGKTYDVDVRVSKDGGATWCSTSDPWGPVCQLTIDNTPANSGNQNFAIEATAAELRMFPNPNRGDQLNFSISAIEEGVNTVSVDIYDLTGKRMSARMIAVADGKVNTVIDLNGELAAGMYLVNITAGENTYTERLVIQP